MKKKRKKNLTILLTLKLNNLPFYIVLFFFGGVLWLSQNSFEACLIVLVAYKSWDRPINELYRAGGKGYESERVVEKHDVGVGVFGSKCEVE